MVHANNFIGNVIWKLQIDSQIGPKINLFHELNSDLEPIFYSDARPKSPFKEWV